MQSVPKELVDRFQTGDREPLVMQPKSRAERVFCSLFVLASLILPPVFTEAYPFTINPMYDYRMSEVAVYRVTSPQGRRLPPWAFGLGFTSCGVTASTPAHYHRGRIRRHDINIAGQAIADHKTIKSRVRRALRHGSRPRHEYVMVEQRVFGAISNEAVGVVRKERFAVYK